MLDGATPEPTPSAAGTSSTEAEIPVERLDPEALKVLRHLRRSGHQAYLVGGCVRDLLLGRTPKDFDIATSAHPEEVRNAFRNCRLIGRRFRLAHVYFKGRKIVEVATFRKNPTELSGFAVRRAEAEAGGIGSQGAEGRRIETDEAEGSSVDLDDLAAAEPIDGVPDGDLLISEDNVFGTAEEDARRRDFTVNGLFYDVGLGEVIDYVGGRADLEAHVIRTIGNPEVRIREDPVRVLRAIRFAAKLDFGIEPATAEALRAHAGDLVRCAPARVLEETLRLLRCGASRRALELLREFGILRLLLPPVATFLDACGPEETARLFALMDGVDQRIRRGVPTDDSLLLAALLLRLANPAATAPAFPVEKLLTDLVKVSRMPRRIAEGTRLLLLAQRALLGERRRRGSPNRIIRSPHFADAIALMELNAQVTGEGADALKRWKERLVQTAPPPAPSPLPILRSARPDQPVPAVQSAWSPTEPLSSRREREAEIARLTGLL
ncbi:MAG TPA: poly(A) polymerase [Myxococcales bacterium]|nr:poly(A) polymerase [Myxococcales bacterium]